MNADQRRIRKLVDRVPDDATDILDVGCVRHSADRRQRGNLHESLRQDSPADRVVGVDLPGEETRAMQREGYDVREADCQSMTLSERFDVIVAGELIEHLPKPGAFLERANSHLRDDGIIVLSTPNPDCVFYQCLAIVGRHTSDEHTCWIGHNQLETLCERSAGLSVRAVEWVKPDGLARSLWLCGNQRVSAPTYIAEIA